MSTIRIRHDDEGVTMIEYGLLAALIAVALIATIILVRNGLVDTFSTIATAMS
jgi:pilus assembly protein Flp/PilA